MLKSILFCLFIFLNSPGFAFAQTESSERIDGFSDAYRALQLDYKHKGLIQRFYQAFKDHDGAAMIACYHPEIEFQDPVFGVLKGSEAKAMWLMLLDVSEGNLVIDFSELDVKEGKGQAYWQAWYNFSATGNPVHNKIQARFEFKDGLIYRHQDSFDLYRWNTMALGPLGVLFGGTDLVQNTVKRLAGERLSDYLEDHPEL